MKGISNRIKKSLLIILSALFLYPSLSLAGQFKITRVYDGDRVMALGHGIRIMVRLVGIDAPETSHNKRKPGQPYSQRSEKYLATLDMWVLGNKYVSPKDWRRIHRGSKNDETVCQSRYARKLLDNPMLCAKAIGEEL